MGVQNKRDASERLGNRWILTSDLDQQEPALCSQGTTEPVLCATPLPLLYLMKGLHAEFRKPTGVLTATEQTHPGEQMFWVIL